MRLPKKRRTTTIRLCPPPRPPVALTAAPCRHPAVHQAHRLEVALTLRRPLHPIAAVDVPVAVVEEAGEALRLRLHPVAMIPARGAGATAHHRQEADHREADRWRNPNPEDLWRNLGEEADGTVGAGAGVRVRIARQEVAAAVTDGLVGVEVLRYLLAAFLAGRVESVVHGPVPDRNKESGSC